MCRVVVSLFSSRQSPALGLFPNLNKPPVQAALGHQFRMGTPLGDTAILHHQNLIRVLDGSQPVGDGSRMVFPFVKADRACWIRCSFSGSTLAVASSRMTE